MACHTHGMHMGHNNYDTHSILVHMAHTHTLHAWNAHGLYILCTFSTPALHMASHGNGNGIHRLLRMLASHALHVIYSINLSAYPKDSSLLVLPSPSAMSSASSVAAASVMTSGTGAAGASPGHGDDMMAIESSGKGARLVTDNGVVITGLCWFECGQPATQNMGTARYPKLVCGPCQACVRAMRTQVNAAEDPEVKKSWNKMARTDPDKYKHMICSARIATSSDMPGVSTLAARDAQLASYKQKIVTEVHQ